MRWWRKKENIVGEQIPYRQRLLHNAPSLPGQTIRASIANQMHPPIPFQKTLWLKP